MGFIIPAALTAGSLIGSLLTKKPKVGEFQDPRLDSVINQLLARTQQGLSPEAQQAFLSTGRQGIGNVLSSTREQTLRQLARQGAGQGSSLVNTLIKNIQQGGLRAQADLGKQLTSLNEQAKGQAFNQLIAALGGRERSNLTGALRQSSLDQANLPDFGQPFGLGLYSLLKQLGAI